MRVLTIEPGLEQRIIESRVDTSGGVIPALPPDVQRTWITALRNAIKSVQDRGVFPIVLCSEAARPLVKASAARDVTELVVLSVPEIIPEVKVESLGEIRLEE